MFYKSVKVSVLQRQRRGRGDVVDGREMVAKGHALVSWIKEVFMHMLVR